MSANDDRLICNACQHVIRTSDDRLSHYKSEWHRYNVKRRCAGLAPVPSTTFNSQLSLVQSNRAQPTVRLRTKCSTCGKAFNSQASFDAHLLSKKHQKLSQGLPSQGEDEDEEDDEKSGAEETPTERKETSPPLSSTPDPLVTATAGLSLSSDPPTDLPLYDGYQLQAGEVPIPLLSCLFCPLTFPSIPDSLSHMHKLHGFYLPYPTSLTSPDGLLTYLGEKVGIGHCCVYCSARFSSTQAVRQHMKEKSHGKMRLDTEEDEEEYSDYYSFEGEEAEGEDGRGGRRLTGVSDAGELVMSDGSTIGHRQYHHIYTQNVRVKVEHPSVQAHHDALGYTDGRGSALIQGQTGSVVAAKGPGGVKESGKRYRETWIRKNERRLLLKVGMAANIQMHYRPQVQF